MSGGLNHDTPFVSGRRMQPPRFPFLSFFVIHPASVFPEVLVALDVKLDQVADFDRVDFSGAAVTDLHRQTRLHGKIHTDEGGARPRRRDEPRLTLCTALRRMSLYSSLLMSLR